tara:strand:+ start:1047 stop:1172 length:126 start_codon:yes stop_codon:yes gene_type:complete
MCVGTILTLISTGILGFFGFKAFKKYIAPNLKRIISQFKVT